MKIEIMNTLESTIAKLNECIESTADTFNAKSKVAQYMAESSSDDDVGVILIKDDLKRIMELYSK